MTQLLRIEESRIVDLRGTKALHRAVDGKLYIGPPISAGCNDKIFVEASADAGPDGYYRIYRVLEIVPERKRVINGPVDS
jgi:hypothetical protein